MASSPVLTPSSAPTTKSMAATMGSAVGGAITILILYWTGWDKLDPKIAGALTTLITAAITFIAAYIVPPGAGEGVIVTARGTRTARLVNP